MPKKRPPSLEATFQVYKLDAQARRVTDATLRTYNDRVLPFIKWATAQGAPNLPDVTSTLLRSYLVSLQERKLSSYTINGIGRAVRAFLNFCVDEGLISESPMRRVVIPKPDKKIMPSLSTDDVQKVFAACESKREEALILFLLDTGVRATEFVALNGGDIDLQSGNVNIRLGKGRKYSIG